MVDLKDELTKRLNGDTDIARSIKSDIKAILTEDWFNSFILNNVDDGLIDLNSRTIRVYFAIERESGLKTYHDTSDRLMYCLKMHQDGSQYYAVQGQTTFGDVYDDNISSITDKAIEEYIEDILICFSDMGDLKIERLLGADQAGSYSRVFRIEFRNPVAK